MKTMLFFILLTILMFFIAFKSEQGKDPYEEGSHWDYSIECVNGFAYKVLSDREGTIQVLNSDGTPLKCGEKIY